MALKSCLRDFHIQITQDTKELSQ
ncbi:hypothetical protein KGM_203507A, partial [Danaus plexippus plexippus]